MQGFKSQRDEINALADTAAGFVWRLHKMKDMHQVLWWVLKGYIPSVE